MQLTWVSRELHPRRAFRISRVRPRDLRNVFVRLERDGIAGYGEAAPSAFYGETWEGIGARLEAARAWLAGLEIGDRVDIHNAWEEGWKLLAPSRAAQCAVDLALYDWLGKSQGRSVSELLWGGRPARAVQSFATIGLSTPEELPEKIAELAGFPQIKIKSDQTADLTTVRRVSAAHPALLAVDANCAWEAPRIARLGQELADLGVRFIEQPLPPGDDESVHCAVPVFADESCVTLEDVERVARRFDGFNIKLVKCGGLTAAYAMVVGGKILSRQLMVGCMLESSALIAAGAALAQHTDYADLDGAWLLGNDPFTGWSFERGILHPPTTPGLGVTPEDGLFPP